MATNEVNSKFIKVSPGTTRIQGDGGAYIGIDETNNIFIGVPGETTQPMASVDADTSPSFFGIISDENAPNIQTTTTFPSNNFHTINFNQTPINTSYTTTLITPESTTSSIENVVESPQPTVVSNQTISTQTILTSSIIEEISNELLFLPDVEVEMFNLYNTGSILEDYYIGISDSEQIELSQMLRNPTEIGNIGTVSVGSKSRLPTKPSEVNPPPIWGNLSLLSYKNALTNINTFPSLNKFSNGLKVFAAITATQEGWNSLKSSQHAFFNPGNLRGEGDKGHGSVGNIGKFARFSSYEKGWSAMMISITSLLNGNDQRLDYDTGTTWINWFKDKDNDWYKSKNVPYKNLTSYSSKNGVPPTFRQPYNIYAPWGDGGNNPSTYAGNVAYTLGTALKKKVNVDDTILNYTK